jgi:molybdopterin-biosynthesis enzyme MoeA-like protein
VSRIRVDGFGLLVIGSEVLDGRRDDAHFLYVRDLLAEWNLDLKWSLCICDETDLIESQLRWAFGRPEPFFCCGGIGSTPDDLTRDCAARALGVDLAYHPEGVQILESRFGPETTPERLRMVYFPCGAGLIPNPVNRVPGFRIQTGYFLPGFPSMAHPMMRWVLETFYAAAPQFVSKTLVLPRAREADLVPLMERFVREHPGLRFSSLPALTDDGTAVSLGIKGLPEAVASAIDELKAALERQGVAWCEA